MINYLNLFRHIDFNVILDKYNIDPRIVSGINLVVTIIFFVFIITRDVDNKNLTFLISQLSTYLTYLAENAATKQRSNKKKMYKKLFINFMTPLVLLKF